MLKTKKAAAAHAENLRTDLDPRSTTRGEHNTKNSVVNTLTVASRAWRNVWNSIPSHNQTAQEAWRNALQPGTTAW